MYLASYEIENAWFSARRAQNVISESQIDFLTLLRMQSARLSSMDRWPGSIFFVFLLLFTFCVASFRRVHSLSTT